MSADHGHDVPTPASRVAAIEALLVERGILQGNVVEDLVQTMAEAFGPMNGARVVAQAWADAAFRERLLADGTAAVTELGFGGPMLGEVVAVENTADVHNVIVCSLCSCYPWSLLGLPPEWYKSFAYRSRMVREPRAVLAEFGLELDDHVELRVWDSSADVRYIVVPARPAGTDGLDAEALAALVTRDGMVGVAPC